MSDIIEFIRADAFLQAVAIIVSLVTGVYYVTKIILYFGRSIWRKISPPLSLIVETYLENSRENFNLACNDAVFLIADIGRRLLITVIIVILYFIIMIGDEIDSVQGEDQFAGWASASRVILVLVFTYQLSTLQGRLASVARDRRSKLRKGDR